MRLFKLNPEIRSYRKLLLLFIISTIILGCIEEFDFENEIFESALVVDATITNESKRQEVKLSKTYQFNEENFENVPESNARVKIKSNGQEFLFEEVEAGKYLSKEAFSAQPTTNYILEIETSNGNRYSSLPSQFTARTQLDDLYVQREVNDDGKDGVSVYVDSFDPSGNSIYYRYEFEETFKIIAPKWRKKDAVIISREFPKCSVSTVPRSDNVITCFRTEYSKGINVTTTEDLNEDRIERHLVYFLSGDDYKISHRYSTLVKQLVITEQAYNYLKTISSFTKEGSLFSQLQTGYLPGNIFSESNSNEKVIGYFQVASISSKRVYFNYADLFPNSPLPPYYTDCTPRAPNLFGDPDCSCCGEIMNFIDGNVLVYLEENMGEFPNGGPFSMVARACGDCTAIGNIEPPEFWVE
jgi:hypothetical protein